MLKCTSGYGELSWLWQRCQEESQIGLLKEEINLPRGASLQAFITLVRGLVINVSHWCNTQILLPCCTHLYYRNKFLSSPPPLTIKHKSILFPLISSPSFHPAFLSLASLFFLPSPSVSPGLNPHAPPPPHSMKKHEWIFACRFGVLKCTMYMKCDPHRVNTCITVSVYFVRMWYFQITFNSSSYVRHLNVYIPDSHANCLRRRKISTL